MNNRNQVLFGVNAQIIANGVGAITGPMLNSLLVKTVGLTTPLRVIPLGVGMSIPVEGAYNVMGNFWVKGTLQIDGDGSVDDYGGGQDVPTGGQLNIVNGILINEGLIINNGAINFL